MTEIALATEIDEAFVVNPLDLAIDVERVTAVRRELNKEPVLRPDYDFESIKLTSPSVPVFLDIPVIFEDEPLPYFLAAVSGIEDAEWPSAIIHRSSDSMTFSRQAVVEKQATIGSAKNKLAAGSTTTIDDVNALTVKLDRDVQLASVSENALLNGSNFAALGDELKGWELIAFQTATSDEDTSTAQTTFETARRWTVSNLLRGLNGTEHMIDQHGIGDRFVVLDDAIEVVRVLDGEVDVKLWWKAVTQGLSLDATPMRAFTYTGVNRLALAPALVNAERIIRAAA